MSTRSWAAVAAAALLTTGLASAPSATAAPATAASRTASTPATVSTPHASRSARHGELRKPRGTLLRARPLRTAAALPSARATYLVEYVSVGARDQKIRVTGTVSLPEGKAPRGGWRVLSWAHGTTGTADPCAPSRDTVDGPAHDYLGRVDQTLDRWSRAGYVVAKTDYEGLGTPGDHPYINGPSAARTLADIVVAARQLSSQVGRQWVVSGHSQGGHAALAAAAGPRRHRGTELLGAVSLAPGGVGLSQTAPYIKNNLPGAQAAISFLPPLLLGAAAATDTVDADALVTDAAQPLLDAGRTGCMDAIREVADTLTPAQVFEPDADFGPLTAYLDSQDAVRLIPRVPTFVAAGTADVLVAKPGVDYLVSVLCGSAPPIDYSVYQGADHRAVIDESYAETRAYADALFRGRTPAGSAC
ncbi:alpha/beta hydrolase [Nocardioides sp. W7]|uniref:serine aminopeptidase domain-containing protein n=1 Tax=Nocardioides sp. W7 TaxID=2931390 RepID=UPI001FD60917|nr:alpha/beta hydrolase [Nocardioides sp. W7]